MLWLAPGLLGVFLLYLKVIGFLSGVKAVLPDTGYKAFIRDLDFFRVGMFGLAIILFGPIGLLFTVIISLIKPLWNEIGNEVVWRYA